MEKYPSDSYPLNNPVEFPIYQKDSCMDNFGDLYREHVSSVYRYYHARLGYKADAEDLTAETFRVALEGYTRYRSTKGTTIAWLMGIARHKLADYFRRPSEIPFGEIESLPGDRPSTEAAVGQALQVSRVANALGQINAARAEALTLHLYVGLSLEETGQVLEKSPQAVKKLVQRGLADLRRILLPEEAE